jgi:hypothetical protein
VEEILLGISILNPDPVLLGTSQPSAGEAQRLEEAQLMA